MDESLASSNPDDVIFAQFLQEFTAAADQDAVLEKFCAMHPRLDADIRDRARMIRRLEEARPEDAPVEMPQQLGECRIVREIGGGRRGKIWEAWHERLQRHVAIKTI